MKTRTISILGLLTALLTIGYGDAANLQITLRPADTVHYARMRLRGDSARIQTRLDWLYDEPGFRPPSDRAVVEIGDDRITVTVSDTSGAARIEYLASTRGRITFREVARDSIAWVMLTRIDDWLQSHPGKATVGPDLLDSLITWRRYDYRVDERNYPLVSKVLKAVDTAVYADWQPVFRAPYIGEADTTRTLLFVKPQPEMSNARGELFASAVPHRPRGARPATARPMPKEAVPFTERFIVDLRLSHDSLAGDPTRKLAQFTASHVRQRVAMMLDTVVLEAPMIQCENPDGSFMVVTDDALGAYARDLSTLFLSGPLYSPLVVERVERVRGK